MERLDAAARGLADAVSALVATCRDDDVFRTATLALVEAEGQRFRRLSSLGAQLRIKPSGHWSGQLYRAITQATDRACYDGDDPSP